MVSDPKLPFASERSAIETSSERNGDLASSKDVASVGGGSAASQPSRSRVWLRRLGVLLFVFFCATLGVMLMILPWRPEWSENPLLLAYPTVHEIISSGFVRGIVTGIGLLNVWIGFWEAIRYREDE